MKYNLDLFDEDGVLIEEDKIKDNILLMIDYVLEQLSKTEKDRSAYQLSRFNK